MLRPHVWNRAQLEFTGDIRREVIDSSSRRAITSIPECPEVRGVSFQITVLKVLAGSTGGRLPLADLRRDVAILMSSGTDWTNRTRRLAARAPGLDIFSQALVVRDPEGWRITDAGLAFLIALEAPAAINNSQEPAPDVAETPPPEAASPPVPLIGITTRRSRRGRRSNRERRSAAA